MLTKLQWSVDTYIETLGFTMSDGTASPKYGKRAYQNTCYFTHPITKIVATYRERGLVSLAINTKKEELMIQGNGEGKHTDKVEIIEGFE